VEPPTKRLTEFSHGAGCGCKLAPGVLAEVLGQLPVPSHPDLLVSAGTADDAAVWRLDEDRALVLTTDFFTPIVDDARAWGRIAATNAASDVYAMGGRPILALNIVAWNAQELPPELLAEVLRGAQDAAAAGGWLTVGGHTIDDPEPKFGLAVVGEVHPDRMLTNARFLPGQALVLTKALGTGVIATAIKSAAAPADAVEAAVASMSLLNAAGAQAAVEAGATGATDITGFGLLGHLARATAESGIDAELIASDVPLLPHARGLIGAGYVSGGTRRNLEWVRDRLEVDRVPDDLVTLLADAQTSGGLLFGADIGPAGEAVASLRSDGHAAAIVGRTVPGTGRIRLVD
jgi:selenide, water dikinase